MALRNRGGKWHYRFEFDGREYSGPTDLAATERNVTAAIQMEVEHRQALREGRSGSRRVVVRPFEAAAEEFLDWAKMEYRTHPSSQRRLATSLSSAREFFGNLPVSAIDEGRLEGYKTGG